MDVLWPAGPALLLDGFSVLLRAGLALPPMTTTRGVPTAAAYGVSSLLVKLLREHHPRGVGVALDTPGPTFRHERFAGYKATRADAGPGLEVDVPLAQLEAIAHALDAPLLAAPGFEADDLLAAAVAALEPRGIPALVVSGDRDLLQLARGTARVLFIGARGKPHALYDADAVRARFSVAPEALPAYIALVGDPSDNLPGVPGIGPRTAATLLARFGTLSSILAHLAEVPERFRAALVAAADRLPEVEWLATLRTDAPLDRSPPYGALGRPALRRLRSLFVKLEFVSLLPRLDALLGAEAADRDAGGG